MWAGKEGESRKLPPTSFSLTCRSSKPSEISNLIRQVIQGRSTELPKTSSVERSGNDLTLIVSRLTEEYQAGRGWNGVGVMDYEI